MTKTCGDCVYFQELPGARYICRSDGAQVGYMDKKPCFVEPVPDNEIQKEASPADSVRTKKCSRCGRTLPVSEFRRSRTGAYYNVCKECVHDKHSATVKAQYAEKAAAEEEKKTKKAPKKAKGANVLHNYRPNLRSPRSTCPKSPDNWLHSRTQI